MPGDVDAERIHHAAIITGHAAEEVAEAGVDRRDSIFLDAAGGGVGGDVVEGDEAAGAQAAVGGELELAPVVVGGDAAVLHCLQRPGAERHLDRSGREAGGDRIGGVSAAHHLAVLVAPGVAVVEELPLHAAAALVGVDAQASVADGPEDLLRQLQPLL